MFASHASWRTVGLAPDMERFYRFVIAAHRNGEGDIALDEFLEIVNDTVPNTGDVPDKTMSNRKN